MPTPSIRPSRASETLTSRQSAHVLGTGHSVPRTVVPVPRNVVTVRRNRVPRPRDLGTRFHRSPIQAWGTACQSVRSRSAEDLCRSGTQWRVRSLPLTLRPKQRRSPQPVWTSSTPVCPAALPPRRQGRLLSIGPWRTTKHHRHQVRTGLPGSLRASPDEGIFKEAGLPACHCHNAPSTSQAAGTDNHLIRPAPPKARHNDARTRPGRRACASNDPFPVSATPLFFPRPHGREAADGE